MNHQQLKTTTKTSPKLMVPVLRDNGFDEASNLREVMAGEADVVMEYTPDAPLEVSMLFQGVCRWSISRKILIESLFTKDAEIGTGAVRAKTSGEQTVLRLEGDYNDTSWVTFNSEDIKNFVDETLELVPAGEEVIEWSALA